MLHCTAHCSFHLWQPARRISFRRTATWHLRGTKLSSLLFRADGSPAFTTNAREPSAAEEEERAENPGAGEHPFTSQGVGGGHSYRPRLLTHGAQSVIDRLGQLVNKGRVVGQNGQQVIGRAVQHLLLHVRQQQLQSLLADAVRALVDVRLCPRKHLHPRVDELGR